jgi:hypothetical protein
LKWIAILLLIGFLGGFFFGVGQAIEPANLACILIGFAGGYFFGRLYKRSSEGQLFSLKQGPEHHVDDAPVPIPTSQAVRENVDVNEFYLD